MSEAQLEEFLSKQDVLWETQKQQIRDTDVRERDKVWQEIDNRMRYARTHAALAGADKFLKMNSIFLPDELREQFAKQITVIWEALGGARRSPFADGQWVLRQNHPCAPGLLTVGQAEPR